MSLTRYGGGTDDYVLAPGTGAPIPNQLLDVFLDDAATIPLVTGFKDTAGTDIAAPSTDVLGYYEWDSTVSTGDVFARAAGTSGPTFRIRPANLTDRLAALEALIAAGGGGGGTAPVTTVAGRQGDVVLAATDISGLSALLANKADLTAGVVPVSQTPQKYAAMVQQVGTAVVGVITPGGIPFQQPTTPQYLVIDSSRAPRGSSLVVSYYEKKHSDQSYTTAVSLSIPVGSKYNFVALTGAAARSSQDRWYAEVTSVGSTEPGADVTVQVLGVGATVPPTALAAPNPPTALTVTNTTTTSNTVAWAAPVAGVAFDGFDVYRQRTAPSSGPLTFAGHVKAGTTSFLDAGLTVGESYAYTVVTTNDDAVSTDVVSTQFQYMTTTSLAADWVEFVGTNAGAAASQSGTTHTVTSGNVGGSTNGSAQDAVRLMWKPGGVATTNSAARITFPFTMAESTDSINILLRCTTITSAISTVTNFVQVQMTPFGYRVGVKAASYNGGSFFNITSSATSPAQATSVSGSTSGIVTWTVGASISLSTKYYVTAELLPVGTGGAAAGKQILNIYLSTATGSPVLQNTVTLDTSQVSALSSGVTVIEFLGLQATTGSSTHYTLPTSGSDMTVVGLAA